MEIELRSHLPPPERVEVFLRAHPDLTWEDAEVRLTSLWVECPAKAALVSMGEACCQGCPHLGRIDYEHQRIECNYETLPVTWLELILPTGAMLDGLSEDDIPPFIVGTCPLMERVVSVSNCIHCLYYRGQEEDQPHRHLLGQQMGWLLCAAPSPQETSDDGSGMFVLGY